LSNRLRDADTRLGPRSWLPAGQPTVAVLLKVIFNNIANMCSGAQS